MAESPPGTGEAGRSSEQLLTSDVLGRFERPLWRLPSWLILVMVGVCVLAVVADVVAGQPARALLPIAGSAMLVTTTSRSRRRPPLSSEISQDGVLISSPAGAPERVQWEQVAGVRIFRRHNRPQLVRTDDSTVQLLAVPDDVARSIAAQLPALLGRPVWFEVDDQRMDPGPR